MDNDFKFRPQKQRNVPTDSSENTNIDDTTETSATTTVPPSRLLAAYAEGRKKGHGLLVFFIMLILLLAAAGGVYYWQHQKVSNLSASQSGLNTKVATLQSQLAAQKVAADKHAAAASQPSDVTDIVTVVPTKVATTSADVVANYLLGKTMASEVWVESGTSPDKLTTVSAHQKTSGEGPAGGYGGHGFSLTGLKPGTVYYYRAAGTVNGKTVDGGIVSFTTTK